MMKNIKEENRNDLHVVPFVVGRIYDANGFKIVCTKRTKCYAEFDVYWSWNNTNIPDRHERLKINVFRNGMEEYVFSDWFMTLHSTDCVEYTEQLIDTLETIENCLAYAEIIDVAEGANVYFAYEYYYKFQRTEYSKPVYFAINTIGISLISSEQYEKVDNKRQCEDIDALSDKIMNFIIEKRCRYGLI